MRERELRQEEKRVFRFGREEGEPAERAPEIFRKPFREIQGRLTREDIGVILESQEELQSLVAEVSPKLSVRLFRRKGDETLRRSLEISWSVEDSEMEVPDWLLKDQHIISGSVESVSFSLDTTKKQLVTPCIDQIYRALMVPGILQSMRQLEIRTNM